MADTKPFEENAIEEGDAPKEAKTIHRTKLRVTPPVGYVQTNIQCRHAGQQHNHEPPENPR